MKNLLVLLIVAGALYWLGLQQGWFGGGTEKVPIKEDSLVDVVAGELIAQNGVPLKDSVIKDKPLVLLYFSAHWCPPCRAFTPKLVRYYHDNRKPWNFEVIFVSSDKTEGDMYAYMREANMPWSAVAFQGEAHRKLSSAYAGPGIPCLVLLDKTGAVLSHSYDGNKYRGPDAVLQDLSARLAKLPKPKMGRTADDPDHRYNSETEDESAPQDEPEPEPEPEPEKGVFEIDPNNDFSVQLTMQSRGTWKAMINDTFYRVNDQLDTDTKITEIGRGLVVVEREGKLYELRQK